MSRTVSSPRGACNVLRRVKLARHIANDQGRVTCSHSLHHNSRYSSTNGAVWRPPSALDEWVEREARPISLRQLAVFGRSLTDARLVSSANYVRTELPTRLAHRLRDMQSLPYVVITNPHMSHVYELYYNAFDALRRIPEPKTVEDNDTVCRTIQRTLREHLTVIPRLISGILECQHLVDPEGIDRFMNTMLKSRISRRVIAEQHLALTETFHEPWHFPNSDTRVLNEDEFVGEVFLKCHAKDVLERCADAVRQLSRQTYGPDVQLPQISITGDLDATLTYIPSHLEYVVGEILRNSMQSLIERGAGGSSASSSSSSSGSIEPIEVLIFEGPQHVILRISDRGGGIQPSTLPHLWSFVKGPSKQLRLDNLNKVPQLSATLQEIRYPDVPETTTAPATLDPSPKKHPDSLGPFASRPPNLKLGIGLPMSKVYAEYWAGSLELQNLEGFGVDVFLTIPKLGNRNEQLVTRAAMDAL